MFSHGWTRDRDLHAETRERALRVELDAARATLLRQREALDTYFGIHNGPEEDEWITCVCGGCSKYRALSDKPGPDE